MKKKLLTLALTATMAISSVISAFAAETLTGTAWWTGMQVGQDYALKGDGSVTLTIETKAGSTEAFSVELYNAGTDAADDGYYMTTGSDGNVWFAELLKDGTITSNPFGENNNADPGKFVAGNTYEVTVTRAGKDFTVVYYDATAGAEIYKMAGTANVDAPEDLNVHVMAQVGEVTVDQKTDAADKNDDADKKDDSADKKDDATKATTTKATDDKEDGMNPVVIVVIVVVAVVVIGGIVVVTKKKN